MAKITSTKFPSFELRRTPLGQYERKTPRPLLPILPVPPHLTLYPPPLPAEAQDRVRQQESFSKAYELTTHLFPAAYPRATPAVMLPPDLAKPLPPNSTKEQRAERNAKLFEYIKDVKGRQMQGGSFAPDMNEQRVLWNCVNRYRRRNAGLVGGRTLLLFHANGFHKETFEPFLASLFTKLQDCSSPVQVDDIWAWEAVNHGDAALVNRDQLGFLYEWSDNTRDILNFVQNYLPTSNVSSSDLPVHLPCLPESVARSRLEFGFVDRTVVGLGHSFGGCTVLYAAIHAPKLFKALVLVDPVVVSPFASRKEHLDKLTKGAISRRNEWSSRSESHKLFSQSPFFSAWDASALTKYVDFALYADNSKDGKPIVRLKMSGLDEAMLFYEHQTGREAWELLKDLDERVMLHWVIAGRDPVAGPKEVNADTVWRRPVNSSNVIIERSGHLIVQEAPNELAEAVCLFFTEKFLGSDLPAARL